MSACTMCACCVRVSACVYVSVVVRININIDQRRLFEFEFVAVPANTDKGHARSWRGDAAEVAQRGC